VFSWPCFMDERWASAAELTGFFRCGFGFMALFHGRKVGERSRAHRL
jgi:hypothetical protein